MIKALRLYIDVIRGADAACILIHHSNKSGTEYRGSQAIGGIVDAVAQFRERYAARAEPGEALEELDARVDTRRVLEIRSRWDGHTKRHLAFVDGQYKLGDVALPLDVQITSHLTSHGATSGSAITTALNVKKQTVFNELKRLTDDGIIVKDGSNNTTAYRMADTSPEPARERALERVDAPAKPTTKTPGTGKERRQNGPGTSPEREARTDAIRPVPEPPSKPVARERVARTTTNALPAA